jgi:hypothetical protein
VVRGKLHGAGNGATVAVAHAKAVPDTGIHMQLRGCVGPFEGEVKLRQTLRNVLPVILAADQKGPASLLWHVAGDSRIDEGLKNWLRALALDRIPGRDAGVVTDGFESGQFSAGGKTHDPEALGINTPLRCPTAREPDRPLDVLEGMPAYGKWTLRLRAPA